MDSKIRSRHAVRPQRLGLPLCMHARVPVKPKMTSSSIHHWRRGRALPSAVQPLHQASEEGRGAEEGREGKQEADRQTQIQPGQTKTVCQTLPFVAPSDLTHVFVQRAFLKPTICKCYHLAESEFMKRIQSKKVSAGSLHHQLFNC